MQIGNYDFYLILVVLGGANYSAIAPPHSYIDASEFPDPKSLAHFLKIVDADDAKFNEYFWWKDFYRVVRVYPECSLCSVLNDLKRNPGNLSPEKYENFNDYWWTNKCFHLTKKHRRTFH